MVHCTTILEQIRTVGFATVPQLITSVEVHRYRELLIKLIDEDLQHFGSDHADRWMVQNLMNRDLQFALLMENRTLQDYLCDLLTDTCIVYAYTSSSMPPHDTNYSNRIHVDCPRVIPGYITNVGVMIALDDFTVDNGSTWFLPHSFERVESPSMSEFLTDAVQVYPRAGDAVIFNARTWHMGDTNHTHQPRHALTMNVCRSYMRQRFDYPRLMQQSIVDQLSETGRRFLGFNVRMPVSYQEYALPESERLYRSGQG